MEVRLRSSTKDPAASSPQSSSTATSRLQPTAFSIIIPLLQPPSPLHYQSVSVFDFLSSYCFDAFPNSYLILIINFLAGPKEWLKERKKKFAKFLFVLADASRNILQSAYLLLMKTEEEFGENDMEEVQKLLVSAARDCVPQDRNSFVEFQANTGVEVDFVSSTAFL
ncbi:hypothetical protein DH2020_022258 [Rehmannia glutinosa]|uniref:Uncharacterized protein n=1 Tax=Rehmannia glutinosa TaxID=99300 RepID=A0ABR0WD65_REHGL